MTSQIFQEFEQLSHSTNWQAMVVQRDARKLAQTTNVLCTSCEHVNIE